MIIEACDRIKDTVRLFRNDHEFEELEMVSFLNLLLLFRETRPYINESDQEFLKSVHGDFLRDPECRDQFGYIVEAIEFVVYGNTVDLPPDEPIRDHYDEWKNS